ncbi:hypothetical protein Lal_00007894 [Lupinus albus]|uniref:Uncharacterized protein n=1 Tax=Lupinus albus TaxID=3870 RepID=A0A6A4P5S9_LUPAL|nr:hypothetical protein Lalb_Chr16g0382641 [Lupinus albus]KAF1875278.1 hypothetical protein Lal_00007894 [Lupinus albus]
MHMGTSYYFLPKFFRVLIVIELVSLLVFGSMHSGRTEQTSQLSAEGLKHEKVIGRNINKHVKNEELDFNYISKRRVPNGPDPIHNRRAGNSDRPPGKA